MARITIIDDDLEHAENLKLGLESGGHVVTTIDDADGAVDLLASAPPELLILDVMFPDNPTAGFDIARTVRRTREIAKLPIILLTGMNQEFPVDFSSQDIDKEWMPVQEFVEKPVKMPKLLEKVDGLLKKG